MNIRWSRWATGMLAVAAIVLMADRCWAIRYPLPPSRDEYGLKYDVSVEDAGNGMLNVVFTLSDEGRLKPLYSIDLVAFSKQTDREGGRAYDVMEPIKLHKTEDGRRVGQVQLPKQHVDRAKIRLITLTVDGKRQPSGGAIHDIPIAKYLNRGPAVASPLGPPSASKVRK